jgi:hypothetical protein
VLFNKERLTLIALTLVALLLAGCGLFGSKSYDIVVRIDPPVEGVKIFVDGVHEATTEADGQVELNNVKANAKLTAELEGYTFKRKEQKVTKAGEYVFEIETSPGRKGAIVDVKTVLKDIPVQAGKTPFEDLPLPSKVEVVLDDDEEVEVAVDWTAAVKDYRYKTPGVYELEGVLVPGEGITNPDNITVKVKVAVDVKPKIKVEADRQTYKSGETISLTLTLQYDVADEPQTVYTYEGSHVVMINWDGASGSQVYNRKATFANGVADGIEFEALEKGEEVTLVVTIDSDEWGPVTGTVVISVEAGDPETLDAEVEDDGNILITVKDKLGQVVDRFESEQAEVQLGVKPKVPKGNAQVQSDVPSSAKPGVDGVAYVSFEKGRATIEMVGSAFAEELASDFGEGQEVTLIVKLVDGDLELETEIKWTIPTGTSGS